MKLEDIQNLWKDDAVIDKYNLVEESLDTAKLHAKYWEILMQEKKVYTEQLERFKNLELAKFWYYQGKMDKEEMDIRKWKPFNISILKSDLKMVIDGDDDIIQYKINLATHLDKVKFVEDIIKTIHQRVYAIRGSIDYQKFQAGA